MRGSVKPHGRLVVWALPAVMWDSKLGYIGGHPTSRKAMWDNTEAIPTNLPSSLSGTVRTRLEEQFWQGESVETTRQAPDVTSG